MTDIVENEDVDKDTLDELSIQHQFAKKYELLIETTVSHKKTYINKISGTKSMKFSIILPDNSIEVYELNNASLSRICHLAGHEKKVTEVVFNPSDDNMLFSAAEDGIVKLWDIRAGGSYVQDYKDDEEEMIRPYECIDVSYNGRVICAGSQVVEDDAFLVFWDQRNPKPLGGYWNSHTEDITQVKFHKDRMEILATGSVDGLVNVFNITEQTEEDALTYSLNMENALERITWLDDKLAACTTQSNDMQVWNLHTGDQVASYKREKIARGIKRSRADDCYLVDAYMSSEGWPVLLAGSYGGCEDTLRSVRMSGKSLRPHTNFDRNRQIVRTCWYDKERDILLTAGESSTINVWRGLACEQDVEMDSEGEASSEADSDHDDHDDQRGYVADPEDEHVDVEVDHNNADASSADDDAEDASNQSANDAEDASIESANDAEDNDTDADAKNPDSNGSDASDASEAERKALTKRTARDKLQANRHKPY